MDIKPETMLTVAAVGALAYTCMNKKKEPAPVAPSIIGGKKKRKSVKKKRKSVKKSRKSNKKSVRKSNKKSAKKSRKGKKSKPKRKSAKKSKPKKKSANKKTLNKKSSYKTSYKSYKSPISKVCGPFSQRRRKIKTHMCCNKKTKGWVEGRPNRKFCK